MTLILWPSADSKAARCDPILPPPTMMTYMPSTSSGGAPVQQRLQPFHGGSQHHQVQHVAAAELRAQSGEQRPAIARQRRHDNFARDDQVGYRAPNQMDRRIHAQQAYLAVAKRMHRIQV